MEEVLQKKNNYEAALLFTPDFNEEQLKNYSKQVEDLISKNGGIISRLNEIKKIKLAYPIRKTQLANFSSIEFSAPAEITLKISEFLKNNPALLRYCVFKTTAREKDRKKKSLRTPSLKAKPRLVQKEEKKEIKEEEIDKKLKEILEKI